ncbi:MAG: PIN domain-containing protein [Candidatus Methylomirabilota bacterium]
MSPDANPAGLRKSANVYLLDTSALLAFIENEDGAETVERLLREEKTLLPWPVLLEGYYITLRERGQAEADRRYALARQLGAVILWEMDEPTVLTAARLKAERRISLADAIVAAFAIRQEAVLIHKDPEFESLTGLLPMEPLPYKPAR